MCGADGGFVRKFSLPDADEGDGEFAGVCVDIARGLVCACESAGQTMHVFTLEGKHVRQWSVVKKKGKPQVHHPCGCVMTAAGEVAVVDEFKHCVQVLIVVFDA